jgi:hypothetical protein
MSVSTSTRGFSAGRGTADQQAVINASRIRIAAD